MFKSTVLLSIADAMTVTGYKRARAGQGKRIHRKAGVHNSPARVLLPESLC